LTTTAFAQTATGPASTPSAANRGRGSTMSATHVGDLPTFDGLLTWKTLAPWLEQAELPGNGPITSVRRLAGGSQHAVFLLERGDRAQVLRRPRRDPTPHASESIIKEGRILAALADTDIPHPALHATCDDESVTGACFYVMEAIDGFPPVGQLPPPYAVNGAWRRSIVDDLVVAAARLSRVDPMARGLSDIGQSAGWMERQVPRWLEQLEQYRRSASYDGELPHVDRVAAWLTRGGRQRARLACFTATSSSPTPYSPGTVPTCSRSSIGNWPASVIRASISAGR
jgi:aminoglycoside phosphotransferase (APT) family kinase protein